MAVSDMGFYNIEDLRQKAKKRLPKGVFEYIDLGAEDYIALSNNRIAYEQLKTKNRVLIDVSKRSTETEIFNNKIKMPYGISPTASAGLTNYGGEIDLARAAQRMGVVCTAATSALTPMEEIWDAAGGENLWFQLYMWVDKDLRMKFVENIQAVGYKTLIVTVDGPVGANREHNNRNGYSMPLRYSPQLVSGILAKPGWCFRVLLKQYMKRGSFQKENYPEELNKKLTQLDLASGTKQIKPDMQCWDDIKRIQEMWKGNLLIKGLQSAEDAVLAAEIGLDGVVLSNHGGRYVDNAPSPLQVTAETRAAVGKDFRIIIDSGPRRGSDIVKALACGANMVMSGRPTLYGVAAAGEAGAYRALEIFYTEMDRIMAQLGLNSVDEIGPQIFWNPPDWVPQPKLSLKVAAE
ncbi:MAG: alpha-hydroxy-acid oxidizing enzyme [Rhodospirillaceae bacterium]|nr:alpha-hydroxy-acid oxidizing enzyme [Rhodospirillaceae bacterium]